MNKVNKDTYFRRNLISFIIVNVLWQFGATMVLPETSLIYFLKEVKASNLLIGSVVPIFTFCESILCILWGSVIQVNKNMKKVLYLSCFWVFIPYLFIYMLLNENNINEFLPVFYVLLIISSIGLSFESVSYQNYVSFVVPQEKRGTLWGIVFSFGYIVSASAYPLMSTLNKRLSVFDYYKSGFLVFFLFAFVATQFFLFTKEPVKIQYDKEERLTLKKYFISCKLVLQQDKNFRNFILIKYLCNFCICIITFSLVYVIEFMRISNEDTIKLTILYCIIFGLGSFVGGEIGDKKGFRFILIVFTLMHSFGTVLLLMNQSKVMIFVIYSIIVLGMAFQEVAVINIPIDSTKNKNKSKYIGISHTCSAPSLLFPIVFGWMVDQEFIRVTWVLGISAACIFMAFIMIILFYKDPRKLADMGSADCD